LLITRLFSANQPAIPSGSGPDPLSHLPPHQRCSRRITITLPLLAHQRLQARSDEEGRSLSNLVAFLLESALRGS